MSSFSRYEWTAADLAVDMEKKSRYHRHTDDARASMYISCCPGGVLCLERSAHPLLNLVYSFQSGCSKSIAGRPQWQHMARRCFGRLTTSHALATGELEVWSAGATSELRSRNEVQIHRYSGACHVTKSTWWMGGPSWRICRDD